AGPAPHARFRAVADRRGRFVPDDTPADAGLRAGSLGAVPAAHRPGRSPDEGHRKSLRRPRPGHDIPGIVHPQRFEPAGQDAGEAHQTALGMKDEYPFHEPIPSRSRSLSFSGVG
ncbi:MAG: hypothetical protein LUP91_11305, partial [Methylococcaceae bacterium]|nr:hypothetical protein [Methylococcaceae bacterium]